MLPSIQKLPRLAMPMLSAMFVLSLSANSSPAQAPSGLGSHRVTAQASETITPTATVVSTAHYQARIALNCGGSACVGDFPSVASKRRLNLTRMSCFLRSAQYAPYASGQIDLYAPDGTASLVQFLPADYSTDWGYHVLNRAIDVQIAARRHIKVILSLATGQAHLASCTAHGTLETLQ